MSSYCLGKVRERDRRDTRDGSFRLLDGSTGQTLRLEKKFLNLASTGPIDSPAPLTSPSAALFPLENA